MAVITAKRRAVGSGIVVNENVVAREASLAISAPQRAFEPKRLRFSARLGMERRRLEKIWLSYGLTSADFRVWTGYGSFSDWIKANRRWSERQFVDLVEENLEGIRGA